MSIAERPGPTELQTPLADEAPQSLASALAPMRSRVLLRLLLRWYWIAALATDAVALTALLIAKPDFSNTARLTSSVCLLTAPMIVAAIRCLVVRLPLPQLAQLIDARGGLQERVASAMDASASPYVSPRMLALLNRDAVSALQDLDLPAIFPLKRDAALAAVALAATFALWFWHAPKLIDIALPGRHSQSSAFQEMTGERHLVTVPAKSNPSAAPKPSAVPSQTKPTASTSPQPSPTPQSSGSHASPARPNTSAPQNKHSAQSPGSGHPQPSQTSAGASTAGKNSQPATGAKAGNNAPTHTGASHSPAPGQQLQTSRQGRPASGAPNHPGSSPPQQTSHNGGAPNPHQQSGAGNHQQQAHSGQQGGASKSNPSGKISGSQSSANKPNSQSKSSGQKGQGQKSGQQPQGKGQGSQSAKPNGSQQNGNSAHSTNSSKGDSSGQAQNRANAHTHPNSPFATGGHGKPLPIQPRDLPAVANRSHFSFRLPKSSGGGLKELPNAHAQRPSFRPGASGVNGSTVPFGNGQAATGTSPGAPNPSDIEQNPRIPAAYRNLVKQYFSNGSGRAH